MPLDLEAIKRRLAAATPGPWHCHDEDGYWYIYGPNNFQIDNSFNSNDRARAEGNRVFIGSAPTDIAALIAEIERLRAILATPKAGDLATCSQCGLGLVYSAGRWYHKGILQPRHPAVPVE